MVQANVMKKSVVVEAYVVRMTGLVVQASEMKMTSLVVEANLVRMTGFVVVANVVKKELNGWEKCGKNDEFGG